MIFPFEAFLFGNNDYSLEGNTRRHVFLFLSRKTRTLKRDLPFMARNNDGNSWKEAMGNYENGLEQISATHGLTEKT